MSETIELSTEELALIEARRAEEKAKADRRAAEEAARAERIRKEKEEHEGRVRVMITDLLAEDADGILYQEEDDDLIVRYTLNGRPERVCIENHVAYNSSYSWRGSNKGLKYRLTHTYHRRFYKNPKTVIKKIKEVQEAEAAKRAAEAREKDLNARALETMKERYPDAEVTFDKGYSYQQGRYGRAWKPDRITVKTDNGSVVFTYRNGREDEDDVVYSVRRRSPAEHIADEVTKLILG